MSHPDVELEWIPRSVRDRLDRSAVRISLVQWQALPLTVRAELVRQALATSSESDYLATLQAALTAADAGTTRSG